MNDPPAEIGRLLAGPHNSRLGPAIHAYNLPAEPDVCVGSTPACEASCYAKGFLFGLQKGRHRHNLAQSLLPSFVGAMIAEVRRGMIQVVRVHTSGDFYDPAYARKWTAVARACAGTTFFAYTRSWRRPDILAELAVLSGLPNVSLWFSTDRDSGPAPSVPRVRRAYLLGHGEAEDGVPADSDLVFRVPLPRRPGHLNAYAGAAKRSNGVLVCPKEQGVARRVEMTCSSCRICFTDRAHSLRPRGLPPNEDAIALIPKARRIPPHPGTR